MAAVLPLSARQGRPRNPLLVRDDVGLAKPSCYDLPSNHFSFGKPGNMDPEGAREVTSQWNEHKATEKRQEQVSFLWLNKKIATAKVTTARDLAKYRRELEEFPRSARTPRAKSSAPKVGDRSKEARAAMLPRDMPQDFVFGRKVRPSTPVQEVVSYQFARDAERELLTFYDGFHSNKEASERVRKLPLAVHPRPKMEDEKNDKELYKLGRFRKVAHKVDSRRKIQGISAFDHGPVAAFSNGHLMPDQGKPGQFDGSSMAASED